MDEQGLPGLQAFCRPSGTAFVKAPSVARCKASPAALARGDETSGFPLCSHGGPKF